jgi:hypothetical protein
MSAIANVTAESVAPAPSMGDSRGGSSVGACRVVRDRVPRADPPAFFVEPVAFVAPLVARLRGAAVIDSFSELERDD